MRTRKHLRRRSHSRATAGDIECSGGRSSGRNARNAELPVGENAKGPDRLGPFAFFRVPLPSEPDRRTARATGRLHGRRWTARARGSGSMPEAVSLGRVAVLDRTEGGRRVLRAVRELAREGRHATAVAVHGPRERRTPLVREADEAVEVEGSPELVLHRSGAEAAWLGPATLAQRAAFADACEQLGVLFLGPSAATLAAPARAGRPRRAGRAAAAPSSPRRAPPPRARGGWRWWSRATAPARRSPSASGTPRCAGPTWR